MQVIIFDTLQYQCVSLSTKQYHFATNLLTMITWLWRGVTARGGQLQVSAVHAAFRPCWRGSRGVEWLGGWWAEAEATRDSEPSLRTQGVSEKKYGPTLYRFRWFSHSNHHGFFQIMIYRLFTSIYLLKMGLPLPCAKIIPNGSCWSGCLLKTGAYFQTKLSEFRRRSCFMGISWGLVFL